MGEEGLEVGLGVELVLQGGGGVAGQPVDDLVDFGLGAVFPLGFLDIERVHAGEGHGEDGVVWHGVGPCGGISGRAVRSCNWLWPGLVGQASRLSFRHRREFSTALALRANDSRDG